MDWSVSGKTLTIATPYSSQSCYCEEVATLIFDREIGADLSRLAEAKFVSGTYLFYWGNSIYFEDWQTRISWIELPEPATWAMTIGGFGVIGAQMRRRKTTVSLA